jgi:hypothetical protein
MLLRSCRSTFPGLLLAVIVALSGLSRAEDSVASWTVGAPIFTYCNWRPSDQIIATLRNLYNWPPGYDPTTLTPEIAQQAATGGFNLVWINDLSQLAIAERYGLRAQLVISGHAPQNNLFFEVTSGWPKASDVPAINALIDGFKASPAAYSYFVIDEPGASRFEHLADIVSYLRQRDPARLAYINLFPADVITKDLETSDYASYLSQFIRIVHPAMLSYDSYNLLAHDRSAFLGNMQIIAQAAAGMGVPFMAILQGYQMDPKRRPLTTDELRFLTYSTLAFGARGISYFNYWTPAGPAGGGIAPFPDGTQTAVFNALRSLAPSFKSISGRLSHRQWIATYLKGYSILWMPRHMAQPPNNAPWDVSNLDNMMTYIDGAPLKGALLGYFGTRCRQPECATQVVVQNLDYSARHVYRIRGPGPLSVFDAATESWTPSGHEYADVGLEPGGGALVSLEASAPGADGN